MATTLTTIGRNAACNGTVDAVDAGSGNGKLKLLSAGNALLMEITLNKPAFGNADTGVATLDTTGGLSGAGTEAAGSGTQATKARFTDSDDNTVWECDVGVGTGAVQMDNNSIADGQVASITGYTHTQPA